MGTTTGDLVEGREWEQQDRSFLTGHSFEGSLKAGRKKTHEAPQRDATPKQRGLGNDSEQLKFRYSTEQERKRM